jgi:cytochrome c oxidase assembly protein subunit 15
MNGAWIPSEILQLEPWYRNFFENMATVQFDHRVLACLLFYLVPAFCGSALRSGQTPRARNLVWALLAMLGLQVALGISTLVLVVPIPLAAAHQCGALLLFSLMLAVSRELG